MSVSWFGSCEASDVGVDLGLSVGTALGLGFIRVPSVVNEDVVAWSLAVSSGSGSRWMA